MDGWANDVDAVYGVGPMACVGGLLSWRSGLQESVSVQRSEIYLIFDGIAVEAD